MASLRVHEFDLRSGKRIKAYRIPLGVAKALPALIPRSLFRLAKRDVPADILDDLLSALPQILAALEAVDEPRQPEGLIYEAEYDDEHHARRVVVFIA